MNEFKITKEKERTNKATTTKQHNRVGKVQESKEESTQRNNNNAKNEQLVLKSKGNKRYTQN